MSSAIVLCGGVGSRLGLLTRDMPKPMMTVGGRPFIAHVLDTLCESGVEFVILAAGFHWRIIADYVQHDWHGLPVRYSVEDIPLGTGGAIHRAMQRNQLEQALVVNGDTLFRIDLGAFLRVPLPDNCDTRVALRHVSDCGRYGRVSIDGRHHITAFGEKNRAGAGLINGGIYLQRRRPLVTFGEQAFSFEADYLSHANGDGRMVGMPFDSYFIDIGIPEDLQRANRELTEVTGDGATQ